MKHAVKAMQLWYNSQDEAQERMKDADYAAYKSEAQSCADEARRNQEDYR